MGPFTSAILLFIAVGISYAIPSPSKFHKIPSEEIDSDEHGQFKGPRSTNCTCGYTNKALRRIVGGKETKVNEYPHMVGVASETASGGFSMFCGGTIVTHYHVITAAHCTEDEGPDSVLAVVAGEHDIADARETKYTKIYMVKKHIEHENYNPETYAFDIAVLVVNRKIQFNEAVAPACLPTADMNSFLVGKYVKVTGWGDLEYKGQGSRKLMKVNLRVVNLQECSELYENTKTPVRTNDPFQICTWANSRDSCQGDSGGPVTWLDPDTNRYTLIGVVSYGTRCATLRPGVNSDVYYFLPWIQDKIARTSPEAVRTCAKI